MVVPVVVEPRGGFAGKRKAWWKVPVPRDQRPPSTLGPVASISNSETWHPLRHSCRKARRPALPPPRPSVRRRIFWSSLVFLERCHGERSATTACGWENSRMLLHEVHLRAGRTRSDGCTGPESASPRCLPSTSKRPRAQARTHTPPVPARDSGAGHHKTTKPRPIRFYTPHNAACCAPIQPYPLFVRADGPVLRAPSSNQLTREAQARTRQARITHRSPSMESTGVRRPLWIAERCTSPDILAAPQALRARFRRKRGCR